MGNPDGCITIFLCRLEEFRFLMFRFDYNEYYDRLSTAPEARELLEAARSVSEDEAQATAESEPGWRF